MTLRHVGMQLGHAEMKLYPACLSLGHACPSFMTARMKVGQTRISYLRASPRSVAVAVAVNVNVNVNDHVNG